MGKMKIELEQGLLDEVLDFARFKHPREAVLLLRGDVKGDTIRVTDYLYPPYATTNIASASYPTHMIPMDFRIVGTFHTHPKGDNSPSLTDHLNFFGRVMVIISYPYEFNKMACYTKWGEPVEIIVI